MANIKMVDGVEMSMTPAEIAEFQARADAWTADAPKRAAKQQRNDDIMNDPERKDLLDKLSNATNAQIGAWVDANVTSLADARKVFKIILRVLSNTAPL
jgi:hypothetical protein